MDRSHGRFQHLFEALDRFDKAEIALVDASSVKGGRVSHYFTIGSEAGGTALQQRGAIVLVLQNFMRRDFHDIVRDIYEESGRVMAPSKIAASAIRIANSLAHQKRDTRDKNAGKSARPRRG